VGSGSKCNYCTLKRMRRTAEERGVELRVSHEGGWTVVRYSNEIRPSAHFLVLTDHCVC
jgi:hypothetical protein